MKRTLDFLPEEALGPTPVHLGSNSEEEDDDPEMTDSDGEEHSEDGLSAREQDSPSLLPLPNLPKPSQSLRRPLDNEDSVTG